MKLYVVGICKWWKQLVKLRQSLDNILVTRLSWVWFIVLFDVQSCTQSIPIVTVGKVRILQDQPIWAVERWLEWRWRAVICTLAEWITPTSHRALLTAWIIVSYQSIGPGVINWSSRFTIGVWRLALMSTVYFSNWTEKISTGSLRCRMCTLVFHKNSTSNIAFWSEGGDSVWCFLEILATTLLSQNFRICATVVECDTLNFTGGTEASVGMNYETRNRSIH